MCCSLQYKDGPRTIIINGFNSVSQAVTHAQERSIDNYYLKVEAD